MKHGKGLLALAGLLGVLALLYALGAGVREGWNTVVRGEITIPASDDFTLSGFHDGDLTVFAAAIRIEPDAVVSGNASLVGSQVLVQGQINGDLSATASQIRLEPESRVGGRAVLTGDTVIVEGAINGDLVLSAADAQIGPTSTLSGVAQVCAGAMIDQRGDASLQIDCSPAAQAWSGVPVAFLTLSAVLAGAVLAAVPPAVMPLRMAHFSAQLRQRPGSRLLYGVVAVVLWGLLAALLTLIPGTLGQVALALYLGATALAGAPLIWLGVSLVSLWIGGPLLRLVRRAPTPEPFAALLGGLLISAALALIGPFTPVGLALLGLLAVIGLAAFGARRTAPDSPRRTSYFVQG